MKKAFTLVELLIVVAVIGILMGIVLRFTSINKDVRERNLTVSRLQRLENALSGYYAAFGTYPPVRLHGSRNIYRSVSDHGIQSGDSDDKQANLWGWVDQNGKVTNANAEDEAWKQVQAACEAQPVACNFPYPNDDAWNRYIDAISTALKAYVDALGENAVDEKRRSVISAGFSNAKPGYLNKYSGLTEWTEVQIFRFGLMSYLLPRYLFMMQGDEQFLEYAQWEKNNKSARNPLTNADYSWDQMRKDVDNSQRSTSADEKQRHLTGVSSISSQAVCARWMANFEKSLECARATSFYGIDVRYVDESTGGGENVLGKKNLGLKIYSPGGYSDDSHAGQYVLDGITMFDGWRQEFYYYSPSPHQTYVVWSGGPNKRTFPPWIPRETLSTEANRCVGYWTKDDIVGMRH